MNPRMLSNQALNGFKSMGKDIHSTFTGSGKPLTYGFRNSEARRNYDNLADSNAASQHKWGRGSLNYKRIGAAAGAAYVGGDAAYRTVSGGSAYRNSRGESDIVGVPFV